jgi:hypothetical protein
MQILQIHSLRVLIPMLCLQLCPRRLKPWSKCFHVILFIKSQIFEVHYHLGEAFAQLGDDRRAFHHFDVAVKISIRPSVSPPSALYLFSSFSEHM